MEDNPTARGLFAGFEQLLRTLKSGNDLARHVRGIFTSSEVDAMK